MFHPFFFHKGLLSCRCHDVLADAMALAAALKVEMDRERSWREKREREIQANVRRIFRQKSTSKS